jgi:hypothetical protein
MFQPGTGTALDGEGASSVIDLVVAPSNRSAELTPKPHAPTGAAVVRWGMGLRRERSTELTPKSQPNGAAGYGDVSTPIDRSAARRARLGSRSALNQNGMSVLYLE